MKNCLNCKHFADTHGHTKNTEYCNDCMMQKVGKKCVDCELFAELHLHPELCGDCITYEKWEGLENIKISKLPNKNSDQL